MYNKIFGYNVQMDQWGNVVGRTEMLVLQKICLEYIKIFAAGNVNNMKGHFTMFGVLAKKL